MIKVLIVEDSLVMQQLLIYTLSADPVFQIVGVLGNGEEAIEAVGRLHPDVITMDWYTPKLDGLQATRIIMETNPVPIVIVTSNYNAKNVMASFGIIEAGALAIVRIPSSVDDPEYTKDAKEIILTLKLMSEIKMVRRMVPITKKHETLKYQFEKFRKAESEIELVAIGASTGGPLALQKILSGLPVNFPVPLLIVQHISPGFVEGFVEWLSKSTQFPLHIAANGDYPLPGHGYVAPDGFYLGVEIGPRIVLTRHDDNYLHLSVSHLFCSVKNVCGSKAIGILLTGMGSDGANELKLMKQNGAVTIAQNKESSVVFGMPGEAIKLNAATYILSPEGITAILISLINKTNIDLSTWRTN
ncbi:MAG: chemotaxis protein CheB [Ignavibacteriaceae bacterium]